MSNATPGLYLADKVVRQISGPISMYYLKPKTNLFFGKERRNMPLIMLWGDQHFSVEGMCPRCEEEKGEESEDKGKKTCYSIYDKGFLQELDKLATRYPVDFYTEYSEGMKEYAKEFANDNHETTNQVLFKRFLANTTKGCHKKTLRNRPNYEHQCPTKAIRWHYADIRFMSHSFEYHLLQPFLIEYQADGDLPAFLEWVTNDPSSLPKYAQIFQQILTDMRIRMYESHEKKLDPETRKVATDLRSALVKALFVDLSKTKSSVPQKWLNVFTAFVRMGWSQKKMPSLILKQVRKMDPSLSDDDIIMFLTKAFAYGTENLHGEMKLVGMEDDINGYSPLARDYLLSFFTKGVDVFLQEAKNDPPMDPLLLPVIQEFGVKAFYIIWKGLQAMNTYLKELQSFTLDIYTLLRMMKSPEESSSPYLVFGFFGDWHTQRIVSMLTKLSQSGASDYFNYQLVYSVPMDSRLKPSHRCISIREPIHLAADLRHHAEHILNDPYEMEILEKYRGILEQEEAGRRGGPSYWEAIEKAKQANRTNQTRKNNKGNKGNKDNKGNKGNKGNNHAKNNQSE